MVGGVWCGSSPAFKCCSTAANLASETKRPRRCLHSFPAAYNLLLLKLEADQTHVVMMVLMHPKLGSSSSVPVYSFIKP